MLNKWISYKITFCFTIRPDLLERLLLQVEGWMDALRLRRNLKTTHYVSFWKALFSEFLVCHFSILFS